MPSSTGRLIPLRRQPPAEGSATRALAAGSCRAPSSSARVATSSPEAMRGNQADFCASVPASSSADAATRAVASKGEAVSVRPSSSATTPRPKQPKSLPP
jgi:hypothetical protein